jgi:hypothetical protein
VLAWPEPSYPLRLNSYNMDCLLEGWNSGQPGQELGWKLGVLSDHQPSRTGILPPLGMAIPHPLPTISHSGSECDLSSPGQKYLILTATPLDFCAPLPLPSSSSPQHDHIHLPNGDSQQTHAHILSPGNEFPPAYSSKVFLQSCT